MGAAARLLDSRDLVGDPGGLARQEGTGSITMSISSAPASTARSASSSLSSSGTRPDGKPVATEATFTFEPRARAWPPPRDSVDADRRHGPTSGWRQRMERLAAHLLHLALRVLASRVVRSIIEMARRMPARFASFLIERLASAAARSSTPTASTRGT